MKRGIVNVLLLSAVVMQISGDTGADEELSNNPIIRNIINGMTELEKNFLNQGRRMAEQDTKLAQQDVVINNQRVQISEIEVKTVSKLLDDCRLDKRLTYISSQLDEIIENITTQHKDFERRLDQSKAQLQQVKEVINTIKTSTAKSVSNIHKLNETVNALIHNMTSRIIHNHEKGDGTYIRWGRTSCPQKADLVYKGYGGGHNYDQPHGSTIPQCLPENPEYSEFQPGTQESSYMYGSGYETKGYFSPFSDRHHHVMPCAVCKTRGRSAVIMIPAKLNCTVGWTHEYHGYLMASKNDHKSGAEYSCVDIEPEVIPGTSEGEHGILFYFVEGRCGSLNCPPYIAEKELTCVVCSA